MRAAWNWIILTWTIAILVGYLIALVVFELSCAAWKFARSVYHNIGVQRYG